MTFLLLTLPSFSSSSLKYAIFVDAGSSGTRYNLYQWTREDRFPTPSLVPNSSDPYKFSIRLSDAQTNSSVIPIIFNSLINTTSRLIPSSELSSVRVIAYATAGLRLLPLDDQNRIMSDVFYYLREHSPFRVKKKNIRVISGAEEGLFGWVAVNTLLGRFTNGSFTIFSEMGGASTQIVIPSQNSDNQYKITINGTSYSVFAYSYLGYGADQALATITKNLPDSDHPCMSRDYQYSATYQGTGNWTECVSLIQNVLLTNPNFTGVKLPSMTEFREFIGISVYAYILWDLKEPENVTLEHFLKIATDFAALNWEEVQLKYPGDAESWVYFFDLAYVHTLITKGFGLSDEGKEYNFPMTIMGKPIGYPFGGLVAQLWDIYIEDQGKISLLVTAIVNGVLLIGLVVVVLLYLKPCRNDVVPLGLLWN